MKTRIILSLLLITLFCETSLAQKYLSTSSENISRDYNGVQFNSTNTLTQNLSQSADFEQISKIFEASANNLIFSEGEMYTVFVETNSAFEGLPENELEELSTSPIRATEYLKYHIVPGRLDSHTLKRAISNNDGTAYLQTLSGEKLGIREVDGEIGLFDMNNNVAVISASNFYHRNGFFHIVKGVVMPKKDEN